MTERKVAKDALRDTQERLRRQHAELELVYHAVPIGLSLLDRDLRFVRINQRLAAIDGLPVESYPGRTVREQLPHLADALEPLLRRVIQTGEAIVGIEIDGQGRGDPGAEEHTYLVSYVPARDTDGTILGVGAVVEDITDRKRAEAALRASEERLRLANEAAGIGTYFCDFRTARVRFSPELCRMLGVPEGHEATEDEAFAFVHAEDRPAVTGAFETALDPAGDGRWGSEFRVVRTDGQVRWLSTSSRIEFHTTPTGRLPLRQMGACIDVTTHKAREETLRESEERLRLAFAGAQEGVWDWNLETGAVVYSAEWKRMLGYAPHELDPHVSTWESLLHEDDRARARDVVEAVLRGEREYRTEFRLQHKDGHYVDVLSRGFPVRRDPSGPVVRIVGTHFDLTERKARETALRQSEERLQFAFAGAQEGVWDWDMETGAVVYSAEWKRMLGFADGEIEPHVSAWERLLHPDDTAHARKVVDGVLRGEREYVAEFRLRHRNGHYVHVLSRGLPIRREHDGSVVRIVGTHFDLTERKRAEAALRESEERLRLAAESTGFGTYDIDPPGKHVVWSGMLRAILGLPPDTEASLDAFALRVHPDDRARFVLLFVQTLDSSGPGRHEAEYRIHRPDGSVRWLRDVGRTMFDGEGDERRAVRVVGTVLDVTDRKQAEELLRRAHDELDARVRERTDDLARANASLRDEMRERARAERARTDLLRRLDVAQEDERRRIAREMHDQLGEQLTGLGLVVRRLKEACDDQPDLRRRVIELERIAQQLDRDVDHLVWELRPTALDDLGLGAALGNYVHDWSRRVGVSVEFHTTGLNEARLGSEIETSLYRIAQEALNNCAKHARATSVDVILERRADDVSLIVEDDGVGFDANDPGPQSQGLGLKGIRERATIFGASVEIESSPGEGTTVLVRMPTRPWGGPLA